jgi:hypothetical protein
VKEAILTIALVAVIFGAFILFEALAQAKLMNFYFLPKGEGYVEPTFRIHPSPRHLAILCASIYFGLRAKGYQPPSWGDVAVMCVLLIWLTLFFWAVGKEMARQRIATAGKK